MGQLGLTKPIFSIKREYSWTHHHKGKGKVDKILSRNAKISEPNIHLCTQQTFIHPSRLRACIYPFHCEAFTMPPPRKSWQIASWVPFHWHCTLPSSYCLSHCLVFICAHVCLSSSNLRQFFDHFDCQHLAQGLAQRCLQMFLDELIWELSPLLELRTEEWDLLVPKCTC